MIGFLRSLFSTGDFMSHGHCYLWDPSLLRLHAIADLFIGAAYVAISATLVYLVRRTRTDIPFSWMFLAFGAFIVACGCTHLVEVWTLWTPVYWFSGSVKVVTAVASVATAIALPPLVPKSVQLLRAAKLSEYRREQLQRANVDLEQEIISRKRTEEELGRSEERFRSLFQNLPVGVMLSGRSGEVLMCNPAAMQLLGAAEIQPASGTVPERQAASETPAQLISRAIFTRQPVRDSMLAVRHPDRGDVVWLLVSSEPQLTTDGGVSTVISTFLDITHRKLAEDLVAEWKNRYEAAIQASGQVLYDWNPLTKAVTFGGSLIHTLGYDSEEMSGGLTHWKQLIHPDDRQRFAEEMDRVAATGEAVHLRFRMRRKDGVYITVQDDGYFFSDPGTRTSRMVGFISDFSGRLELEEQLLQAQKLESVGRLAGGVAHDFNNLLTVILGHTEMLGEQLQGHPAMDSIEEIESAAKRAELLTKQLLAFSRRQVLRPRVLDLNDAVVDTERMLRRLIGENIKFQTVLGARLGRVRADGGQLQQVIMNLVLNARDAMPEGGNLSIETEDVDLSEDYAQRHAGVVPGPYVMLAVKDSGTGMDNETLAHVFEPFFTTKGQEKGTGLGLSMVYGIVMQSGGHIAVESECGAGTTMRVYLPRVDEPGAMEAHPPAPTEPVRGTETILLVEDEDAVRTIIDTFLRKAGYKVLVARGGVEALSFCETYPGGIHLMITDVVMPEMDGRTLAAQATRVRSDMKVLYISGYAADAVLRPEILEAGAEFLSKPFSAVTVNAKVREVLDSPRRSRDT